ncbi:hypothetical protein HRR90_008936 [Exophiala dermatitidis]|nr:hypothetical protein HRR74_008322 [Exophiala dermatitidis]KAJ4560338.1 hypothetical protein HRR79_008026 [Exophiala dermatitidis]KAJ4563766.1 hypothetical protein HRR81_008309 [Exophiala dermatitidis]KAJ4566825.1 hypothetical protein HRR82_008397 [Exophiala dermatitidis]KAJ4635418.1 hypothetical protein HRR89_007474 [Exophiala dermatitidis]
MASVAVPSRHKALVYDNPGKLSAKIEEIETPKPGVGEVLVNLTHSGGKKQFGVVEIHLQFSGFCHVEHPTSSDWTNRMIQSVPQ